MYVTAVIVIALSATMFMIRAEGASFLLCEPCNTIKDCQRKPEDECKFGQSQNTCGRWECAKGPLESCGGYLNRLGQCGEGMTCRCNRCMGCYAESLQCALSNLVLNC
ncbi:neuroparsin-A-like [Bacillus rossius redtenbacheri]|uniref:neuroparsin-A-like n=1 Tax=Bacillus rossius redtenbacheri TaxID=93214 RepID=UPI002FDE9B56